MIAAGINARRSYWSVVLMLFALTIAGRDALADRDGGNVVCVPDTLQITTDDDIGGGVYADDMVVSYLGGGSADLWGFSVVFTWDPTIVSVAINPPASGAFANLADEGFFVPLIDNVAGSASVNCAIGGTLPGTAADDLFIVTFTAVASAVDAYTPVVFGTCLYRDADNEDLSGMVENDGLLHVFLPPDAGVACVPLNLEISLADHIGGGVYADDLVVSYLGGGSANLWGYSVAFTWDPALLSVAVSQPASGAFANLAENGFFIPTVDNGSGSASVDCAIGGTLPGTPADDLFVITCTALGTPAYATTPVAFGACVYRDSTNADILGIDETDGTVVVDLVAPVVSAVAMVNNTLAHTDDYLKNGDELTITATVTDAHPLFARDSITADLSGLGGSTQANPGTYDGLTATWVADVGSTSPADGVVSVPVLATDPLGNSGSDSGTITADNTPPVPLTGLVATPGHRNVDLVWDDPAGADLNYYGVAVRYRTWGDYPEYATAAPAYPADHTAGLLALTAAGTGASHSFAGDDRDVYFYAGFIYDLALNYSPTEGGGANEDRATNYWLGDVSDGTYGFYDGYLDIADVTALGSSYGLNDGEPGYKNECDVGPTHNGSAFGVPEPDDLVKFEDLMIFAMNYTVITPQKSPLAAGEPALAWRRIGDRSWVLELLLPEGGQQVSNLKGLSLSAPLPPGTSVSVEGGALLGRQPTPVFLKNVAANGLDLGLAILGSDVGFAGSGELCVVVTSDVIDLSRVSIRARGVDNVEYSRVTEPVAADLPKAYVLEQNFPNPFNPQTTIRFGLPAAQEVSVAVYGVDGSRVRKLLAGSLDPGYHEVSWDGRNDRGATVASGMYFCKIVAGQFSDVRKMVLAR